MDGKLVVADGVANSSAYHSSAQEDLFSKSAARNGQRINLEAIMGERGPPNQYDIGDLKIMSYPTAELAGQSMD